MNAATRDIIHVPVMSTIRRGIMVDRPFAEAGKPELGPHGSVSVSPAHLQGVGAVMHIALHHVDGETMVLTMGGAAFREFALAMNHAAERIQAGDFDEAETTQ